VALLTIQVLNGVSYGMLLFLLAAGLTLTFGLLRIVNLTHGSYYMLGGYVGFVAIRYTGSFLLGTVAGAGVVAAVALIMKIFLLDRFPRNERAQVLLTFGCLFLIGDLSLWLFGGTPLRIPTPYPLDGAVEVLGRPFPVYRFALIAIGLLVALFLWWFHDHTRIGTWVRGAVHNRDIAQAMGVNVPLLTTGVFILGAALAAIAGVVGGPLVGMYPGGDIEVLGITIAIIILGGVGSLRGAFAAAIFIGLLDTAGRILFPDFALFAIFGPMLLVLAFRPGGLAGQS
jgi:branched-chain amino acid transport system permease protein